MEATEDRILLYLDDHSEELISFDEIVEKFSDSEISHITHLLNNLLKRGLIRQVRASSTRIQNHYQLVVQH